MTEVSGEPVTKEAISALYQGFSVLEARKFVKEALHKKFDFMQYDHEAAQNSAKEVADAVKQKLKEMNRSKYKYIVQAVVGQNKNQGMKMSSKCFWDASADYLISEHYSNDVLFVIVVVYVIYHY